MKQSALIQQTEEYMDNEVFGEQQPEQSAVAQPIPDVNLQMQTTSQPAIPTSQPQVAQAVGVSTPSPYKGEGWGDGPVLKNVGAKIPYSIYDRLERIKRQSERSGIKADKRNIGDLIAQAIKEFVEKYDVQ